MKKRLGDIEAEIIKTTAREMLKFADTGERTGAPNMTAVNYIKSNYRKPCEQKKLKWGSCFGMDCTDCFRDYLLDLADEKSFCQRILDAIETRGSVPLTLEMESRTAVFEGEKHRLDLIEWNRIIDAIFKGDKLGDVEVVKHRR